MLNHYSINNIKNINKKGEMNHSGSYMLNEVLYAAKDMGIFEAIGKEKLANLL
ncbi:hypothetical protein U728_1628 [Clostridium botulinum 202F]|nr:hypothetical protein U728_1628 [Clostridium botulinum 202F]